MISIIWKLYVVRHSNTMFALNLGHSMTNLRTKFFRESVVHLFPIGAEVKAADDRLQM